MDGVDGKDLLGGCGLGPREEDVPEVRWWVGEGLDWREEMVSEISRASCWWKMEPAVCLGRERRRNWRSQSEFSFNFPNQPAHPNPTWSPDSLHPPPPAPPDT